MKVTEIIFHDHCRVTLIIQMPEAEGFTTAERPHLPRLLFKLLPQMATQRCFNEDGYSLQREAQATEIPHLFEHLLIEIQNQVRRGIGPPISGETRWNWSIDPRGRFYVTVDYDNEIIALGAVRLAESLVNALDSRDLARVDMTREITRLREIARLTRRLSAPPPLRRDSAEANTKPPDSFYEESDGIPLAEAL